jgi:hypothetical protein
MDGTSRSRTQHGAFGAMILYAPVAQTFSKGNDDLFLLKTSTSTHDPACFPTKIILDAILIKNYPRFIDYLRSKELHSKQSVPSSLSLANVKSFLSTHGCKIHLNQSSIYQVIGRKKAKYLREVADTYCMVSSFLHTYHHDNPDAMVAL